MHEFEDLSPEEEAEIRKKESERRSEQEKNGKQSREETEGYWFDRTHQLILECRRRLVSVVDTHHRTRIDLDGFVEKILAGRKDFNNIRLTGGNRTRPNLNEYERFEELNEYLGNIEVFDPTNLIRLDNADLGGLIAKGICLPLYAPGAVLTNVDFSGSKFPFVYFDENTVLKEGVFVNTEFAEGKADGTKWKDVDVRGASGDLMTFYKCDIRGIRNLDQSGFHARNFVGCKADEKERDIIKDILADSEPYVSN